MFPMKPSEFKNSISNEISRPHLLYFPGNKPSKSVTIETGRFIVLNDSASLRMVVKIHSKFLRFLLKVLELFEYRRGDPYITANRNFVCFASRNQTLLYSSTKVVAYRRCKSKTMCKTLISIMGEY